MGIFRVISVSLLLILWYSECLTRVTRSADKAENEYGENTDFQSALIAITRKFPKSCSVVLIFDELMPILSVSSYLMQRLHFWGRMITALNLKEEELEKLSDKYGTVDRKKIIGTFLNNLYRSQGCYIFHIWLEDPGVLYSENNTANPYHPGWRSSDKVVVVAYHLTNRLKYRQFIRLSLWKNIPNIVALKRSNFQMNAISIFTVLPYFRNKQVKPQELDVWFVKLGYFKINGALFENKFKNLNMANVNIGTYWKEPYMIWGNIQDPYLDGIDWRLINLVRRKLNFTGRFKLTKNSAIGNYYKEENSSGGWTGLMKGVAEGDLDLAVGGISVTPKRLQDFGFCRTYYSDSFSFISPLALPSNTIAFEKFLKPLSNEVWFYLIGSVALSCVFLKMLAHLEYMLFYYYKEEPFQDVSFKSLSYNMEFLITTICQKAFRHTPTSNALKFAFYSITVSFYSIGLVFASCLIGYLLKIKPLQSIDKIEEIPGSRLKISIQNYRGFLNSYMESSENRHLQYLWTKADLVDHETAGYTNRSYVIDEVVEGLRIHVDSRLKLRFVGRYSYFGKQGYKFHLSSSNIVNATNIGWPIRKNWPLIHEFDNVINRAVESGLVHFWLNRFLRGTFGWDSESWKIPDLKKYIKNRNNSTQHLDPSMHEQQGYSKLNLDHMSGLALLWVSGISLATVIFIIEINIPWFIRCKRIVVQKRESSLVQPKRVNLTGFAK